MKRIYLEAKAALFEFTGAGHAFLVIRDAPPPNGQNTLEWRQTGDVIRGGPENSGLANDPARLDFNGDVLTTYVGPNISKTAENNVGRPNSDNYSTQDDVDNRPSIDITSSILAAGLSVQQAWDIMADYANRIHAERFDYEIPDLAENHTSNSNSVIFSVLNAIGVEFAPFIAPLSEDTPWASSLVNTVTGGIFAGTPFPGATGDRTIDAINGRVVEASGITVTVY